MIQKLVQEQSNSPRVQRSSPYFVVFQVKQSHLIKGTGAERSGVLNDHSTEITIFFSALVVNLIIDCNYKRTFPAFDRKQNNNKANHRRTQVNLDDRPFRSFCLRTLLNAKAFDNCCGLRLLFYLVVSYPSKEPRSFQKPYT